MFLFAVFQDLSHGLICVHKESIKKANTGYNNRSTYRSPFLDTVKYICGTYFCAS